MLLLGSLKSSDLVMFLALPLWYASFSLSMLTLSIILCLYKHTEGQYKVAREFSVFGSEHFIVDKVNYLQKFNFLLIKIIAF